MSLATRSKIILNFFLGIWVLVVFIVSCRSSKPSYDTLENENRARVKHQTYIEDSSLVFFTDFPNPLAPREFLSFCSFKNGKVELVVRDANTDTIEATYDFLEQEGYGYEIEIQGEDYSRMVTCTICVDGRDKCRRESPLFVPGPEGRFPRSRYIFKKQ